MTFKGQQHPHQHNEYYLGLGSDLNTGALYIKKPGGGHTLVSYSKINEDFHIMLVEFKSDFNPGKFTRGQQPRQVSMLDIIHIIQSLRNKIFAL